MHVKYQSGEGEMRKHAGGSGIKQTVGRKRNEKVTRVSDSCE